MPCARSSPGGRSATAAIDLDLAAAAAVASRAASAVLDERQSQALFATLGIACAASVVLDPDTP